MNNKKPMPEMDMYKVIKNPLSTEKGIRLMESENKLLFVVDRKATNNDIKKAIEKMFKSKVVKVNSLISPNGQKRAYVKFSDETPAIDIATQLGLM
jgi:large subunit ribosomal protein L23